MAKTVDFHDADMRRAWEEADAAERDAEQNQSASLNAVAA